MADFTEHASPAPERQEFDADHPTPSMPTDLSHSQVKCLLNKARVKAFADFFGPVSKCAPYTHLPPLTFIFVYR